MITKSPSYVTEDKQTFLTLEAAQGHELKMLWENSLPMKMEDCPLWVWNNREMIIDILTTTPTSKPRARKVNKKKAQDASDAKA